MPLPSLSLTRKESLLSLLDDKNKSVRDAVITELKKYDHQAIDFLLEEKDKNPVLSVSINEILDALEFRDTEKEFIDFIHSLNYELETGFLMLDRVEYPQLEISKSQELLDKISGRVQELMTPPMSAIAHCNIINRVLFHEFGFRGNQEDYYNPKNASLSQVLENKKGLPIILSIIYILVADRTGLQLEPIAFPGHFMVGCFQEEQAFFIDTYESGALRNFEDLAYELQSPLDDEFIFQLAPAPVGEILCRNCRNLANSFQKQNDHKKAKQYQGLVKEFEAAYKNSA